MVYTESIRGYPYMKKEQLAKEFQISTGTVRTRLFEIENQIKNGRYNDYAIIRDGNIVLINVLVFIDYLTYRRQLLDRNARNCGLGRRIYDALANRLKKMGILNLYACIGYPQTEDEYLTKNSQQFHAHLGFQTVGLFHNCGYKFGRWYDMIWMEKIIGEHKADQPPVQFFR